MKFIKLNPESFYKFLLSVFPETPENQKWILKEWCEMVEMIEKRKQKSDYQERLDQFCQAARKKTKLDNKPRSFIVIDDYDPKWKGEKNLL